MARPLVINTIILAAMCIFVVYRAADLAWDAEDQSDTRPGAEAQPVAALEPVLASHEPKTWITMGLCWSGNTKFHGKDKFPYKDALPLSTQLWMRLTPAKVLAQIVYTEAEAPQKLLEYKRQLEGYGATVKLVPATDMECVLKAQLIRVLAFQLPEVSSDDIVLTADVDAFIMTPDILRPLRHTQKQVWLYRYELTLSSGYTFMMPFIGARARTWKDMLKHYDGDLPAMVNKYRSLMGLSVDYTWDTDQHIVSYAIMTSGLCSLPKDNKLWQELKLEPKPFNDTETCFHGSGVFEDCNSRLWMRNMMIKYHAGKCKWWHFYPDERLDDMTAKFNEIVSGRADSIVDSLVSSARSIQKDMLGKVYV